MSGCHALFFSRYTRCYRIGEEVTPAQFTSDRAIFARVGLLLFRGTSYLISVLYHTPRPRRWDWGQQRVFFASYTRSCSSTRGLRGSCPTAAIAMSNTVTGSRSPFPVLFIVVVIMDHQRMYTNCTIKQGEFHLIKSRASTFTPSQPVYSRYADTAQPPSRWREAQIPPQGDQGATRWGAPGLLLTAAVLLERPSPKWHWLHGPCLLASS